MSTESTRTSPTPSFRTPSPSIVNLVMEQTYELIRYGTVVDTYNTGKGYAFVTMRDRDGAEKAVKKLHGVVVNGKKIKVLEHVVNEYFPNHSIVDGAAPPAGLLV